MNKFLFPLIFLTLLLMGYLSKISYDNTENFCFQAQQVDLYQRDEVNQVKQIIDSVLDSISFHYFGGKEQVKLKNLKERNNNYLENNMKYWIIFIIIFSFVSMILLYQEKELFYPFLLIVTLLTLGVSMITPILLFSSELKNTHYIGHVNTYSDEVKTIIGTFQEFLLSKKYFFILGMFLFMMLSFIKSILVLFIVFAKKISFISQIKKWIILELLFVNLIFFIWLLSIIQEEEKRGFSLESGFYFYIFYTFLSILFLFKKVPKQDFYRKKGRLNSSLKDNYY